MKLVTIASTLLFALCLANCTPASPVNAGLGPSQCFLVDIAQSGTDELTSAMARLASANGLSTDSSSPAYVAYRRDDGSYAAMLTFGMDSSAILTSYKGGESFLDLAPIGTSAKGFTLRPCPPTSNSFSPPTIYGQ